jgi:hypothetical protein
MMASIMQWIIIVIKTLLIKLTLDKDLLGK